MVSLAGQHLPSAEWHSQQIYTYLSWEKDYYRLEKKIIPYIIVNNNTLL